MNSFEVFFRALRKEGPMRTAEMTAMNTMQGEAGRSLQLRWRIKSHQRSAEAVELMVVEGEQNSKEACRA
jgi:hypothetical protein